MRQRSVLLTGASGFIGTATLRCLLADGNRVTAICRFRPDWNHPRLTWREVNILQASEEDLVELVRASDASHCIHAAWYTNHSDYLTSEMNRQWLSSSVRLAWSFYRGGGKRFVGLGSCIEYESSVTGPRREGVTSLFPNTLYAECKLALLNSLEEMSENFAWARIFFVYGPGDRHGRLVPAALANLSKGEVISTTFGGLRRDYIHVEDLAGQLVRILVSSVRGPINTGSGVATTIADLVRVIGEVFGRPDLVCTNEDIDLRLGSCILPDLTKFRLALGDPQARSLRQGLAELVHRERLQP